MAHVLFVEDIVALQQKHEVVQMDHATYFSVGAGPKVPWPLKPAPVVKPLRQKARWSSKKRHDDVTVTSGDDTRRERKQ